jgi:hypothetical protein
MSEKVKIYSFDSLSKLAVRLRDDLNSSRFVLLYAYNGTGKTRLSMEFKEKGKKKVDAPLKTFSGETIETFSGDALTVERTLGDTLYFNAFTEDLFHWDNDLENNSERKLQINSQSKFFNGFKELALEEKIFAYLERYAEFNFKINYDDWKITFSKDIKNPNFNPNSEEPEYIIQDNIKVSRGEENIFIWCIFLSICELVIDGAEAYQWVKFIYIDDPISSLDDNNAIAVASDLAKFLKRENNKLGTVISSHHSLFFNVMYNELRKSSHKSYFLHKNGNDGYTLQSTKDTPFFHHVATISELKKAIDTGEINTYHFNMLRSIMDKTATFFGYEHFSKCIYGVEDEVLFTRALDLMSHGAYSIYEPVKMGDDNKELFKRIFTAFISKYEFDLPVLIKETA